MMRRTSRALLHAIVPTLAVAGCGDGGTGPTRHAGGLAVVAGAGVTDTVLAAPAQALVVEVRDSTGALQRGMVVRFQAVPPSDSLRRGEAAISVCVLTQATCGEGGPYFPYYLPNAFAADTTGSGGLASVAVRLGTVAGPAAIAISVPELGLVDTARFTVRPGAPAHVTATVHDTAVFVGARYSVGGAVADRFFNRRGETSTYGALDAAVADVDAAGAVTTKSVGRARVVARYGELNDTSWVSVVPRGSFTAYRASEYGASESGVITSNLDGSGVRFVTATSGANGVFPVASPRTGEILFHEGGGYPRLVIVDSTGAQRRDFLAAGSGLVTSQFGRFSSDGATVSFVCYPGASGYNFAMCEVGADGTGVRPIAQLTADVRSDVDPVLSPDGTTIVYGDYSEMIFLTVATGQIRAMGARGIWPRWSPSGDLIAYVDGYSAGALKVVRPDGSGARTLGASASFSAAPEWSPDGQWILVRGATALNLVRVADGVTLPLPFSRQYYQASWRP